MNKILRKRCNNETEAFIENIIANNSNLWKVVTGDEISSIKYIKITQRLYIKEIEYYQAISSELSDLNLFISNF